MEEVWRPFLYEFALYPDVDPRLTTSDDVDKYRQAISIENHNTHCNELIFLAGCALPLNGSLLLEHGLSWVIGFSTTISVFFPQAK